MYKKILDFEFETTVSTKLYNNMWNIEIIF